MSQGDQTSRRFIINNTGLSIPVQPGYMTPDGWVEPIVCLHFSGLEIIDGVSRQSTIDSVRIQAGVHGEFLEEYGYVVTVLLRKTERTKKVWNMFCVELHKRAPIIVKPMLKYELDEKSDYVLGEITFEYPLSPVDWEWMTGYKDGGELFLYACWAYQWTDKLPMWPPASGSIVRYDTEKGRRRIGVITHDEPMYFVMSNSPSGLPDIEKVRLVGMHNMEVLGFVNIKAYNREGMWPTRLHIIGY